MWHSRQLGFVARAGLFVDGTPITGDQRGRVVRRGAVTDFTRLFLVERTDRHRESAYLSTCLRLRSITADCVRTHSASEVTDRWRSVESREAGGFVACPSNVEAVIVAAAVLLPGPSMGCSACATLQRAVASKQGLTQVDKLHVSQWFLLTFLQGRLPAQSGTRVRKVWTGLVAIESSAT